MVAATTRREPTFLYVGGSKCGSSWLFEILREHPDVFVPVAKDIKYYDVHKDRPVDWYLEFFAGAGSAKAVGELTHDYFLDPAIAARIHGDFPNVQIIFSLREPADRTFSRWLYARVSDLPPEVSFGDYARRPAILRENDYLANLKPYFDRFPRHRIHVIYYDEFVAEPAMVVRALYRFIGVDEFFVPPSLHRRVLAARQERLPGLGRFAYAFAQVLRGMGGANVVGAFKRDSVFDRLLYREMRQRPPMPESDIAWIRERFRGDYEALGELIGRPVPTAWLSS